jgi:predicted hydrocarbon binding protein
VWVNNLAFTNTWIKSLLDNLEQNMDKEELVKTLEDCGRNCCKSSGFYKKAQESMEKSQNLDEFLNRLQRVWNHVHKEENRVYVVYEKCYCPLGRALAKQYPEQLRDFCNCSVGWVKEMFESAMKKPVKVELKKSIIRGDNMCRFEVAL